MMEKQKIMSSFKKIADWTVPPNIQSFLLKNIPKIRNNRFTDPKLYKKFKENSKFRDIHKGERCFILATGPSINRQNLLSLKDEICVSVSNFFLHPYAKKIDPLYHVFAANHFPFDFSLLYKEFEIFKNNSSEKTILFLGYNNYRYSQKNFLDAFPEYAPRLYYFINYNLSFPIDEINYSSPKIWDISANPFSIRSVLYSAIQIAVYMGFKDIYLLGADHNYLNETSQVQGDMHFYSYDQSPADNQGKYSHKEEVFLGYYHRWVQYRLMRKYLEKKGISIYNATDGSFLDVFPFVRLVDIISDKNTKKRNHDF